LLAFAAVLASAAVTDSLQAEILTDVVLDGVSVTVELRKT